MNDAVSIVLFNAFAKFVERENYAEKVLMGVIEFVITLRWNLSVRSVLE
jgi:hypothetical protein